MTLWVEHVVTHVALYIAETSAPSVIVRPSTFVIEGDDVCFECTAESESTPAHLRLPVIYTWSVRGLIVEDGPRYHLSGEQNTLLTIKNVQIMENVITCAAREEGSPLESQTKISLTIEVSYATANSCANCDDEVTPGITTADVTLSGTSTAYLCNDCSDNTQHVHVTTPNLVDNPGGDPLTTIYRMSLFSVLGVVAISGVVAACGIRIWCRQKRRPVLSIVVPLSETYLTPPAEDTQHSLDVQRQDDIPSEYMTTADNARIMSGVYFELNEDEMISRHRGQSMTFATEASPATGMASLARELPSIPEAISGQVNDDDDYLLPVNIRSAKCREINSDK